MKCPCCGNAFNNLKTWHGYLQCARGHLFSVKLENGQRWAVVERDAPEEGGCKIGQRFPIPDGEILG